MSDAIALAMASLIIAVVMIGFAMADMQAQAMRQCQLTQSFDTCATALK